MNSALVIHSTFARQNFKATVGQNNHFLITILIGLHEVEKGKVAAPESLSAAWNPRSAVSSARRSRSFAIQSLLAWSVDALDTYVKSLRANYPASVPERVWVKLVGGKSETNGLGERLVELGRVYAVDELTVAMLSMAVVWRNRVVHFQARNKLDGRLKNVLLNSKDRIAAIYQGLDVERSIKSLEEKTTPAPTLKEVTAFVRASHAYVEAVDARIVLAADLGEVAKNVLSDYLTDDLDLAKLRVSNVWGNGAKRASSSIRQILINHGRFSGEFEAGHANALDGGFIEELALLHPKAALVNFFAGEISG